MYASLKSIHLLLTKGFLGNQGKLILMDDFSPFQSKICEAKSSFKKPSHIPFCTRH